MSSSTETWELKPIFTREILYSIEESLADDGEYIECRNSYGKTRKARNLVRESKNKEREPWRAEFEQGIMFTREVTLRIFEAKGKADEFFPVMPSCKPIMDPKLTDMAIRSFLGRIVQDFEASPEAAAMTDLIRTQLKGSAVDKVMGFGLGIPSNGCIEPPSQYFQHAAAILVARAVREVSSAPKVDIIVQDPGLRAIDRQVLARFDIQVVHGYGAVGFTMIDENTIVLSHDPTFPLREIIADLARPALISMARQDGQKRPYWADLDSVRSRKMLEEYHPVDLSLARDQQKAFPRNTWYIHKRHTKDEPYDCM
ncbi:hypothetical protein F4802DRAFT_552043 [Xylaria palmicola]|nr:hypothetical protein F4802DRAFT_552043 [Xylaria palmicola]